MLDERGYGPFELEYQFAREKYARRLAFDIAWPGVKLAVEVEGGIFRSKGAKPCPVCKQVEKGAHGRIAGIVRDIEKYNLAAYEGWRVIRVTTNRINWDTVDLIGAMLLRCAAPEWLGKAATGGHSRRKRTVPVSSRPATVRAQPGAQRGTQGRRFAVPRDARGDHGAS